MMTRSCQLWGTLLLSITMLSFALGSECDTKNCTLKCRGKNCETQNCGSGVNVCEMDLECNNQGQDCEQTCDAKICTLKCRGQNCKTQKCGSGVNVCEMDLECNNQDQDCEQTCDAKNYCTLKCRGQHCKTQKCGSGVNVCEMDLKCNNQGQDCERTCDAKRCSSTKCSDSHCITSDSHTSSIVTSIGAPTTQVFATKIPTEHGTEAYTLLQSLSQSPLPSILPSPLPSSPSSPSHSPSAPVLSAGASVYLSTLSPSSSNPAVTSASVSSSAASSKAISTAGASASSSASAPSPSSSKPIETLASSSGSPAPASSSAGLAAVASSLLSSLSDTSAAGSSSSLSQRTPQSSRLEVKNLANDSVSKLKGEEINRTRSLMEAIRIFEDFITSIKILQNSLTKEEIEITRNSIFKVADALEVFALNYGKHQMIGANSSVEINSHKLLLAIQKTYRKNASDFYLRKQELQASLKVSFKSFHHNVSVVVGIVYKDLHEVLITDQPLKTVMGTTRYLDSWITAVALDPKPEKLLENVIFRFKNLKIHEGEKKCMFWSGVSESSGGFSETGCHLVTSKSNSEETVCSCNHLTHFAVLLDYNGSPGLKEEDETFLEITTYVGLSLSIFAILLTIILYSYLTDVWQPLTQIRLSLSVSLGAGQIIFLTGINATENTALCVLAAAFLQYILMAAFCWMLVEGIYFFLFVVKVYNINTKMHMYHFISWGLPIIMVSISISIAVGKDGIKSYTSEK